jgi:Sel1 repeat/MYND finger
MSSIIKPLCAAGCGKDGISRCARCVDALYCAKECQSKMWQQHKGPCKEMAARAKAKAEFDAAVKIEVEAEEADDIQTLCSAGCGEEALERCSLCAGAKYCGRKCQKKHWPEHKELCKEAVVTRNLIGDTIEIVDKKIAGYKRDAEAGDAFAQFNLGLCYFKGTGVTVDKREAVKWYTRAAEAGHVNAQHNLGRCYMTGNGVAVDKCKRAADTGNSSAQGALGSCYFFGEGVDIDKREAIKWFTLAAKAGVAIAQKILADIYKTGDGVAVDLQESNKWHAMAAVPR